MTKLKDGILLYHASYTEIKNIDLEKGRKGLDFGRGFYVTSSYEQARNYVRQTIKKAKRIGSVSPDFLETDGVINIFRFHYEGNLQIMYFEDADVSWLHFVASNRDEYLFPELMQQYNKIDIIGGKVANDYTARTLSLYTEGAYGIPGEKAADDYTLRLLMPNKLQDQFCFRTKAAKEALEFVRGDRYGDR